MGWRNKRDRDAFFVRRSQRRSALGRELEDKVGQLLAEMRANGEIEDFVQHAPNSPADQEGSDFTVRCRIGDVSVTRSFGVTISHRVYSEKRHRNVPEFCFPVGTNKETKRKRILGLFKQQQRV